MAGPNSIKNIDGQSTDTLYTGGGVRKGKLAIGTKSAGLDDAVAWQAVATHQDGDTLVASDGVVLAAGKDGTTVRGFKVDSTGRVEVNAQGGHVDDVAFSAGDKVAVAGFIADEASTDSVDEGDAGYGRMTLDRKQIVAEYTHAAGGALYTKLIAAGTTNGTLVKSAAGTIYSIIVNNQNAAVRYLKLYNKATAPTVGTDTPVMTLALQASRTETFEFPKGLAFATGIGFGLTTGVADNDTGAVTANEHVVNIAYA